MVIITGIFNDPFGALLPAVFIQLTARKTTTVSITGTNAAAVTDGTLNQYMTEFHPDDNSREEALRAIL